MYANDFFGIAAAYEGNSSLMTKANELIKTEPIHSKALKGGNRDSIFRGILSQVVEGQITFVDAINELGVKIPRRSSIHADNNRVFSNRWEERLLRTEFSRFYNQAVLIMLESRGEELCTVPHSPVEDNDSRCTLSIAGKQWRVSQMLEHLINIYSKADFRDSGPKIPNHPNCVHVVKPLNL